MKKYLKFFLAFCLVVIITLYFIPIPTKKMCGESPLCWYKYGVYNYEYDAESGGNTYLGGNIHLYQKVGGVQEFFMFKKVHCN